MMATDLLSSSAAVSAKEKNGEIQRIATHRKARFEYEVEDELEAGIVLRGTEVKSLREGKVQLGDAYAVVEQGEVWLVQLHIAEYSHGNVYNHDPRQRRKLLLHRREIEKLARRVDEKGLTLIPLEMYFKKGRAKVKLGVCRGKKQYDKRATVRARDLRREAEREES
jgi:SsrA-binding protein